MKKNKNNNQCNKPAKQAHNILLTMPLFPYTLIYVYFNQFIYISTTDLPWLGVKGSQLGVKDQYNHVQDGTKYYLYKLY